MITLRFRSDYDNDSDLETINSIPRVPTCNIPHSHYKAQYMKSLLRVYIYNTSNLFDRKTNLNVWNSVHSPAPVQAVYKLAPISPTNGKRNYDFPTTAAPFTPRFSIPPPPPRSGLAMRAPKMPPAADANPPPLEPLEDLAIRACSKRSRTSWSCCSNLWFC